MPSSSDHAASGSGAPIMSSLSPYEQGATTVLALSSDPRFSYCLYVPKSGDAGERSLLSVIHGSYRNFTIHRDQFQDFAEANNCMILAPLFPGNVLGDGNLDGFKYMFEGDIRYDRILEQMVSEVCMRYGIADDRFGLVGFSGGAHFAHRFFLLRPHRLWGVSVGAPGSVTLLDPHRDWWTGVRDIEDLFGVTLDGAQLATVPVQLVVGDADIDTGEIHHRPGRRYWVEGANDAGATRPERLRTLERSLLKDRIAVVFELLPGVGHEAEPIFAAAQSFLSDSLEAHRAGKARNSSSS